MKIRKNKDETDQGRPSKRPLDMDKMRFLVVPRSIRFRVKSSSDESFEATQDEVRQIMRSRHKLRPSQEDDFDIIGSETIQEAIGEFTDAIAMVVTPITLIALTVGGIVIMNIMLVSVTERTREIGLRMAVGATSHEIMSQFLIESIVLSLVGGIIGIVLGIGGSFAMSSYSQWKAIIDPKAVLLAFGFSAAVGVFFGLYPARKASLLDPIDALRHE